MSIMLVFGNSRLLQILGKLAKVGIAAVMLSVAVLLSQASLPVKPWVALFVVL